jgi:UDP-N-acetylglucosamine--dolichyl-phosphate N-acetylglucosaminephosphotransferase
MNREAIIAQGSADGQTARLQARQQHSAHATGLDFRSRLFVPTVIVPLIPPAIILFRLFQTARPSRDPLRDFQGRSSILASVLLLCVAAVIVTSAMVPKVKSMTVRANLWGHDLGRRGTSREKDKVAESLGIVPGTVYLVCITLLGCGYGASSPEQLASYNAALASITFMLFLGFADDVLDLRWRYKLILPFVASLPLLCCYWTTGGSTHVSFPAGLGLENLLSGLAVLPPQALGLGVSVTTTSAGGVLVDLGAFYFLYAGLMGIFCTNSINIYSGINGLEAGQAYIVACAILTMNLAELAQHGGDGDPGYDPPPYVAHHLLSAMLIAPFVAVTAGLLRFNWFPASVFVGDTFCYFAGMTFAVVGIMGHFSKTLLLLLLPQLANFVISLPQLAPAWVPGAIPCPRHRLPKFNAVTGLREPSLAQTGQTNRTLINLVLTIVGPVREETLCTMLLTMQWLVGMTVLAMRYKITWMKE